MPDTVGRWALRVPESGDDPDIPADFLRLATDLSNVAMDDQGTLAARPISTALDPSNKPGRYWYVTGDTDASQNGRLWRDMGSGWVEVAMNHRPVLTALPGSPGTGDEVLWQTPAMAAAGVRPSLLRYNGSAWEEVAGSPRRGLVSAYRATTGTVAVGSVIVFDTEEFDVSGRFNTVTGLYTPEVGRYEITWTINGTAAVDTLVQTALVKDGATFKRSAASWTGSGSGMGSSGQATVVANGTNAFGIAIVQCSASPTVFGGASQSYMQCRLIDAG